MSMVSIVLKAPYGSQTHEVLLGREEDPKRGQERTPKGSMASAITFVVLI